MKYQLTQEQWLQLHTLIGETKGTLECAAFQLTEEQKHLVSPFRCLAEQWEEFIEIIKNNKHQENCLCEECFPYKYSIQKDDRGRVVATKK